MTTRWAGAALALAIAIANCGSGDGGGSDMVSEEEVLAALSEHMPNLAPGPQLRQVEVVCAEGWTDHHKRTMDMQLSREDGMREVLLIACPDRVQEVIASVPPD